MSIYQHKTHCIDLVFFFIAFRWVMHIERSPAKLAQEIPFFCFAFELCKNSNKSMLTLILRTTFSGAQFFSVVIYCFHSSICNRLRIISIFLHFDSAFFYMGNKMSSIWFSSYENRNVVKLPVRICSKGNKIWEKPHARITNLNESIEKLIVSVFFFCFLSCCGLFCFSY